MKKIRKEERKAIGSQLFSSSFSQSFISKKNKLIFRILEKKLKFLMDSFAASSSSTRQEWRYDVFLSFRGEDTRNNFTSHLYRELLQNGIITYKDDKELLKGESLAQNLPKAILDSRILVVIFSKHYATSMWCLNELVKIFECKKAGKHIVLPIFYDVSPREVREQSGEYGEPFTEYEKLFKGNIEKVQQWRTASTEMSNLSGWHLNIRDESEFIQDIVEHILSELRKSSHSIAEDFVGMESRLEKIKDLLNLRQLREVRIIGICGMGGIGKTTIASVVYKHFYAQFECCCFLQNVRETSEKYGIISLQKQLLYALLDKKIKVHDVYRGMDEIKNRLRRKRILVILDDVDDGEQLELLIGKRDGEHWFGIGSRIIITTRDEHLLKQRGVNKIYKLEELNDYDAFKLFSSKAFKNNYYFEEELMELCNEFVKYACGLPLALKVLGSSLYGKSLREWKSTLEKLKEIPNEKVLCKLQLSYNGLSKISQKIFLDIACFFQGMEECYVVKVLDCCGFFPDSGIGELIDKSLIIVSNGYVRMHDLIQEMGREIVRRESCVDPGLRSRVWLDRDVYHIQMKTMETEQVEAVVLRSWKQEESLSAQIFSKVKKLRLLIVQHVPTSEYIEYLSNELRYLEWYGCPSKSFPSTFQADNLVQLHMQWSNIEQLWRTAIKPIKLLKIIDLSHSKSLIKTPDFREVPNLEELNLEGCESLCEVHQSIGVLERLVLLNLMNCRNLATLPNSMCELKSLKTLVLRGCSNLVKLPDRLGNLTSLVELDAAGIGVQQMELAKHSDFNLPSCLMPQTWKNPPSLVPVFLSFSAFPFLKKLNLSYCNLPVFPSFSAPVLKRLNLSYCNLSEGTILNDLSGFLSLKYLNLSGNNFVSLPSNISNLPQLYSLHLSGCQRLQSLPDLQSTIVDLVVVYCTSLESLPNLSEKDNLKDYWMDFSDCINLKDNQRNISVAYTWLKSYLLSFLKIRQLHKIKKMSISEDHFQKMCCKEGIDASYYMDCLPEFELQLPGTEIPEWITNQTFKRSLKIHIASCEKLVEIAGFVVCVLSETACTLARDCHVICSCKNNGLWSNFDYRRIGRRYLIGRGSGLESDHLCFFFVSTHNIDTYEKESLAEVKISFFGGGIKKCGIRMVHDNEIQELIKFNELVENSTPDQNFAEIYSSDSGEEDSSDSEEEVSPGWDHSSKRKMMQRWEAAAWRGRKISRHAKCARTQR